MVKMDKNKDFSEKVARFFSLIADLERSPEIDNSMEFSDTMALLNEDKNFLAFLCEHTTSAFSVIVANENFPKFKRIYNGLGNFHYDLEPGYTPDDYNINIPLVIPQFERQARHVFSILYKTQGLKDKLLALSGYEKKSRQPKFAGEAAFPIGRKEETISVRMDVGLKGFANRIFNRDVGDKKDSVHTLNRNAKKVMDNLGPGEFPFYYDYKSKKIWTWKCVAKKMAELGASGRPKRNKK